MLTRRRFLGYSAASLMAISTGCRPQGFNELLNHEETVPNIASTGSHSLAARIKLAKYKQLFLGYPVNMNTPPDAFFTWQRQLREAGIGTFAHNNVGSPYKDSPMPYNTHDFERDIIHSFGQLLAFPEKNTWGFLSHSGTDSNMHGMYMGRTILKNRSGVIPKAYFTQESHYSIQILRDLLGLEAILVETLADGGMDPSNLKRKLADNPNHPALVIATTGTTFKGAIDQVDQIQEVLKNYTSYLHLDAALFGGYLPYTTYAEEVLYRSKNNFITARYDSIAVSCHKFFGFPSPAGLFITTKTNFDEFNEQFSQIHDPAYIHQVPGTITCSRDAVKPAEFYFFSTAPATTKLTEDAQTILQNTTFLLEQMQTHFPHFLPTRANNLSNIIYFKKPSNRVVKKYSLASMHWGLYQKKQAFAHIVVMPHVSQQVLTEFLTDLEQDPVARI